MFDTLKIYIQKEISLEEFVKKLVSLRYCRAADVLEEGDFSLHGDTLEVFPVNFNSPLRIEWEFDRVKKIYSFDKTLNKKIVDYNLLIIIPRLKVASRRQDTTAEELPLEAVLQIKKGDYVVHSRYGIGKFKGLKKITAKEKEDFYFELEYERGDRLYVSREEAHLIQKYSNFGSKRPRLTRLGSKEWARIKDKVQKGVRSFALGILKMQAQRTVMGGFRYSRDGSWQKKFEASFPYSETPDQIKAAFETKQDMEEAVCMDRVICGDVGYGKTEVAMRAAFKAVMDHKQVVFLVPTTILACQHYTNLIKRLEDFPFYVEMLSRFRTTVQQKDILEKLSNAKIDIVVGTHRLLSSDVVFKDLGLLIIDEEHKFGVEHKERIKKLKSGVDVLTLTATPIPRTLYMGLIGMKAISLIRSAPRQRLAVQTKIIGFDAGILKEAMSRELSREGQIFFIHNRIETIEKIRKVLERNLSSRAVIGVVHGRMPVRQMEKVMLDFINKKIDCLLSTAIIESGIDIPSANTIIINNAQRFGLADLHQLRGRVGRFNRQAYAYLVAPPLESIASDARQRLRMIEEFSHLGAGFEVAMSDLEMRGAGNILGKEQHGFIWLVGFDLYCRLLKKEVDYLREAFNINKS